MITSFLPGPSAIVFAGSGSSNPNADALSALGIDTSKAPEGFGSLSTDNPYGRDIIEISPVYELYTVGLEAPVKYVPSFQTTTNEIQYGENTQKFTVARDNKLKATLYGHEKWDAKTVEDILDAGKSSTIKEGTTYVDGNYTLISQGIVDIDNPENSAAIGCLNEPVDAYTILDIGFQYTLSDVAAGNFDKNKSGLSSQTLPLRLMLQVMPSPPSCRSKSSEAN